jgi:putative heme-binding domain-containing protein
MSQHWTAEHAGRRKASRRSFVPALTAAAALGLSALPLILVSASLTAPPSSAASPKPAAVGKSGDPETGRKLFVKFACIDCHGPLGGGGDVGPDLAGVGARRDHDYLVRAILDPNADLAPGYGTVRVKTKDGKEIKGAYQDEDDDVLRLKDAKGKVVVVQKKAIEKRRNNSPMPAFKPDAQELADLVAFLESQR